MAFGRQHRKKKPAIPPNKFTIFPASYRYMYKLIVKCEIYWAIILIIHLSFSACGVHRLGKFTMTLNYHNNHKTNRLKVRYGAVCCTRFKLAEQRGETHTLTHMTHTNTSRKKGICKSHSICNCKLYTKPITFRSFSIDFV